MTRLDPDDDTELTAFSNDATALSQQQVPTVLTNPIIGAESSSTYHNPEQGQGEKGTYHVVEASEDQGQAFFLNPFGMDQYENTDYRLNYDASFTEQSHEQSQIFTNNSFGDHHFLANYDSALNDESLQF